MRSVFLSDVELDGYFLLPEGADITEYDLDAMKQQLKEEYGLFIKKLLVLSENKENKQ